MFEEHMDDQNSGGPQGQVPGNLPMTEPEDIFEGGEGLSSKMVPPSMEAPQPQPVSPSTNEQKSALDAGVLKPKASESASVPLSRDSSPRPQQPEMDIPMVVPHNPTDEEIPGIHSEMQEVYNLKDPNFGRALLKILLGLIILGGLIYGGWYAYGKFFASGASSNV